MHSKLSSKSIRSDSVHQLHTRSRHPVLDKPVLEDIYQETDLFKANLRHLDDTRRQKRIAQVTMKVAVIVSLFLCKTRIDTYKLDFFLFFY